MTFPVIDAHQHVWDPARARYPWLGPEHGEINRAMSLDMVEADLDAAGIDRTILVQSADNVDDTVVMREAAAADPRVAGIVGFVPLDDPAQTAAVLESWKGDSLMVGVRCLIHDRADADWLLRPEVAAGLALLERADVPFDVVAVLPRHLEVVSILSERHPLLRMVIDHLAKPPIGIPDDGQWNDLIAAAAQNPRVYAKVSGLYSSTGDPSAWTTESIRPFVDRALELFGPSRLMYGGDWPISVLAGGYSRVWAGLRPIVDSLDPADRDAVLGRTAADFYRLTLTLDGGTP